MSTFTVTPDMASDITRDRANGATWGQVAKPYGIPWQSVRAGYLAQLPAVPTPHADTLTRKTRTVRGPQPRRLTRAQRLGRR